MGVCEEVEGGGDDTFSEVTEEGIWCVTVGGCCVLLLVVTVDKLTSFFFVTVKLVDCVALVVMSVACSAAEEEVLPAKEQTA